MPEVFGLYLFYLWLTCHKKTFKFSYKRDVSLFGLKLDHEGLEHRHKNAVNQQQLIKLSHKAEVGKGISRRKSRL